MIIRKETAARLDIGSMLSSSLARSCPRYDVQLVAIGRVMRKGEGGPTMAVCRQLAVMAVSPSTVPKREVYFTHVDCV